MTSPSRKIKAQHTLIIPGRAFSAWGKSAALYKAKMAEVAARNIDKPLTQNELHVKVDYFYKQRNRVDGDNLLKNLLDDLKGIAYLDDSQVTHTEAYLHDLASSYTIEEPTSTEIFDWLGEDREFVAVLIRARPRLILKSHIRRSKDGK